VLLTAGKPRDRCGVVRLTLHQRKCLEHRVVQMGGEPLALLLAGIAGTVPVETHQHADRERSPIRTAAPAATRIRTTTCIGGLPGEGGPADANRQECRPADEQQADRGAPADPRWLLRRLGTYA
jgi:hypothetical protein